MRIKPLLVIFESLLCWHQFTGIFPCFYHLTFNSADLDDGINQPEHVSKTTAIVNLKGGVDLLVSPLMLEALQRYENYLHVLHGPIFSTGQYCMIDISKTGVFLFFAKDFLNPFRYPLYLHVCYFQVYRGSYSSLGRIASICDSGWITFPVQ